MSYICDNCHVSQLPRTPAIPVVTETRKVEYMNHVLVRDGDDEGTVKEVTSKGFETVTEIRVCPGCAAELKVRQKGEKNEVRNHV